VWFLLLAVVSAVLINLCGSLWYGFNGVSNKPIAEQIDEQLSMPAVMPYDVWVIEPWGAVAANALVGGLLALSVLFLLWSA
jgi:hypothetical protein